MLARFGSFPTNIFKIRLQTGSTRLAISFAYRMFHFRINTVIVIEFPGFPRTLTIRNSEWTKYSSKRGSVVPAPSPPPSSQPTNCNLNAKLLLQLVMSHYNDTLQASVSWSANAHVKWGLCSTSFWLLLGFISFAISVFVCVSEGLVYAASAPVFH